MVRDRFMCKCPICGEEFELMDKNIEEEVLELCLDRYDLCILFVKCPRCGYRRRMYEMRI
jgi:endogenous inhibitor of DNA gyrase (YacG/DUF329 family)